MRHIFHMEVRGQMKQILFRLDGVTKHFPSKKIGSRGKEVKANESISFEIYQGEVFGLVGESGCGKSTLGRVLLQLYPPSAGSIIYYGKSIKEILPEYRMRMVHRLPDAIKRYKRQDQEQKCMQLEKELTSILGGLLCSDHLDEVVSMTQQLYENWKKQKKNSSKKEQLLALEHEEEHILNELGKLRKEAMGDADYERLEKQYEAGIVLNRLNKKEMRAIRKELQLIFQNPYSSLDPKMTVGRIIGEGVYLHHLLEKRDKVKPYVTSIMQQCGLAKEMYDRYPHQFSGGQRQRIGIARSLALQPQFVVCDEAVSALDVSVQAQIINLLLERKQKQNLTYLFISHDFNVIRYVSDRIGVMYLGHLVEVAECEDLFSYRFHPYTKMLLSSIPSIHKTHKDSICWPEKEEVSSEGGCVFCSRCPYYTEICLQEAPQLVEYMKGHWVACHHVMEQLEDMEILPKE